MLVGCPACGHPAPLCPICKMPKVDIKTGEIQVSDNAPFMFTSCVECFEKVKGDIRAAIRTVIKQLTGKA